MDGTAKSQGKYEFHGTEKKKKTTVLFSRAAALFYILISNVSQSSKLCIHCDLYNFPFVFQNCFG